MLKMEHHTCICIRMYIYNIRVHDNEETCCYYYSYIVISSDILKEPMQF